MRLTICSWGCGWGWGLSLLCWPPLGLRRPTSSWPRPELRRRLKIFRESENISHFTSWKYFTFPAVLKNSAVAPIWSEHPRLPFCPYQGRLPLALCQSHLKRTVTAPAIKMDKSQSTLLCLLSISQISRQILSRRDLLRDGTDRPVFPWQPNILRGGCVGRWVSWEILPDICDNPGREQDCSEDKDTS